MTTRGNSFIRVGVLLIGALWFAAAPIGGQCPPNHWYCPEWPANCILVGCQKTCGDCTYTCAFSQGRDCPPLIMCESC